MRDGNEVLQTIEAFYAAGLEAESWPSALASLARLTGGAAAIFEVIDKPQGVSRELRTFGVPAPIETAYTDHFVAVSPRVRHGARVRAGDVGWDYQILDEAALRRDPFYADFLTPQGFRYFVSTVLEQSPQSFAVISVQRTPRQGHVGRDEIELMQRLTPHLRQAYDMANKLRSADSRAQTLQASLDWIDDGVALLRRDGMVLHANEALQAIARARDGLQITAGYLEFAADAARAHLRAVLGGAMRLREGEVNADCSSDFAVNRPSGAPAYALSVRPLPPSARRRDTGEAIVLVFIRDRLSARGADARLLSETFGLTPAEAQLAQALQEGVPLTAYAHGRGVSLNTVYTHLRRLKDKLGCHRIVELLRKLNDLRSVLRPRDGA